jgi:hypothetical protein
MKRKLIIFALVILIAECNAQEVKSFYHSPYNLRNSGAFDKKSFLISTGIGFSGLNSNSISFSNNARGSYSPKLYLEFEHGFLRDEIGLGVCIESSWGSRTSSDNEKISETNIGISGYYHFNKLIAIKRLDVYTGLGLIYTRETLRADDKQDFRHNNILFNSRLGARYYFLPKVSLYVQYSPHLGGWLRIMEKNNSQQYLSCGITIRLNK